MVKKTGVSNMVTLYTINCPKCLVLEKKLQQANIKFTLCTDREIITSKGYDLMPVLEVDGKTMGFKEAIDWAKERS